MALIVQGKNAASYNWIPHLQDGLFTFDTPNLKHAAVSIQPNCGNDAYPFRIKNMPLSIFPPIYDAVPASAIFYGLQRMFRYLSQRIEQREPS